MRRTETGECEREREREREERGGERGREREQRKQGRERSDRESGCELDSAPASGAEAVGTTSEESDDTFDCCWVCDGTEEAGEGNAGEEDEGEEEADEEGTTTGEGRALLNDFPRSIIRTLTSTTSTLCACFQLKRM